MLLLALVTMALDGQFCANIHLNGRGPFRFLVDTGATMTVIDRTVAGIEPTRSQTALSTTGALDAGEALVHSLCAGDFCTPELTVLIAGLPRFVSRGRVDGILGMDFFAGHSVLFEHDRVQIDATPISGVALDAHDVVGRVAISLEGLNFILDSGAAFVVLTSQRSRGLAMRDGVVSLTSAAGVRQRQTATIPHLRIGNAILRDLSAVIAPRNDPREDALLPIALFESVFISADRTRVIIR